MQTVVHSHTTGFVRATRDLMYSENPKIKVVICGKYKDLNKITKI